MNRPKANILFVVDAIGPGLWNGTRERERESKRVRSSAFARDLMIVFYCCNACIADVVAREGLSNLQKLQKEHISFELSERSYPLSATSMAASIACGSPPSVHGVVANRWITPLGMLGLCSLVFMCVCVRARPL